MPTITAEEWEVLGFFGVEPSKLDEDIAWPYNDFLYVVSQGDLSLSCAIAPGYKDVRIVLEREGLRLFELNAVGVKDLIVINDKSQERMEIEMSDKQKVTLTLRPHIQIAQHFTSEP